MNLPMTVPASLNDVLAIAAGGYQSVALRADGVALVWGSFYNGSTYATAIYQLQNVVSAAAGSAHIVALRADALITAREWHTATLLPNGKVRIAGGGRGNDSLALSSAELYDSPPGKVTPVNLADLAALPDGSFHLAFTNTPGLSFRVLGTTDVAAPREDWTMRGAVIEFWPGQYHFTDTRAPTDLHRFYRVVTPGP